MWSHYAKAHRGVCLVFDAKANSIIGDAYQVQYSEDYPVITLPDETSPRFVIKSFLTKPVDWRHEQEYRIVAREHRNDDRVRWQPKCYQGFVDVSPTALVGVILGAFIDSRDAEWVHGLVASASHPVELWQAHLERGRYALRLERQT